MNEVKLLKKNLYTWQIKMLNIYGENGIEYIGISEEFVVMFGQ